jgi:hypothetical protein
MACLIALAGLLRDQTAPLILLSAGAVASGVVIAWDVWGKGNRIFLVGPLAIVTALAAIGWDIGIRHSMAHPVLAHPSPLLETKKEPYLPPTGEVGAGGIKTKGLVVGAVCQHSLFDPYPRDAFRCGIPRHPVHDPCFLAKFVETLFGGIALVCPGIPPWLHPGRTPVVVVVARRVVAPSGRPPRRWERPWALELRHGMHCTRGIPHETAPNETKYFCVDSTGLKGWVTSFPAEEKPLWIVEYVPETNASTIADTEDVVRAWE